MIRYPSGGSPGNQPNVTLYSVPSTGFHVAPSFLCIYVVSRAMSERVLANRPAAGL
jgi:hypothetical protein